MHPYDVKQSLDWVVHLIGRVMVATWLGVVVSLIASSTLDTNAVRIFVGWWPLILGIWLLLSHSPMPRLLPEGDDDEEAAAAASS